MTRQRCWTVVSRCFTPHRVCVCVCRVWRVDDAIRRCNISSASVWLQRISSVLQGELQASIADPLYSRDRRLSSDKQVQSKQCPQVPSIVLREGTCLCNPPNKSLQLRNEEPLRYCVIENDNRRRGQRGAYRMLWTQHYRTSVACDCSSAQLEKLSILSSTSVLIFHSYAGRAQASLSLARIMATTFG